MTTEQAISITEKAFEHIKKSKTILDLEDIYFKLNIPNSNRLNLTRYPKINFSLSQNDVRLLLQENIIDNNLTFKSDFTSKLTDPLSKILYATVWKQGDLLKIKHIIRGVLESENDDYEQFNALVFHNFGRYLTKNNGHPIIDQHVIRAYAVYRSRCKESAEMARKIKGVKKSHRLIITEYKNWLKSDSISSELKGYSDYVYHIDKVLFAIGKTIKINKDSSDV